MAITTRSDQETKDVAKKLATTLKGGDVVCLHGELGAGKTTFVKGLAEGLDITEMITSPTFTLMNVYELPEKKLKNTEIKKLIHIDTYRLKNEQELIAIGVEDYLGQPGVVTVIEWPEKVVGLLNKFSKESSPLATRSCLPAGRRSEVNLSAQRNSKVTNVSIDHLEEKTRSIVIG